jgi:hypothetical protein
MKIKYTYAKDAKGLTDLINKAVETTTTAKNQIQIAAVAVLYHAHRHGDYTGANQLVLGLIESGMRRASLVKWFQTYGGLVLNEDKDTLKEQVFSGWNGADYIKLNFETAKTTLWFKAIAEKEAFISLSLQDDINKLLIKYGKQKVKAEKAGVDFRGKISTQVLNETIEQLMTLISQDDIVEVNDVDIIKALEGKVA